MRRDSSGGIVTTLTVLGQDLNTGKSKKFLSSPKLSDRFWGPPSGPLCENRHSFPGLKLSEPKVRGAAVAQLVEARRYKPAGRGFDSPWCQ
jgi:hypothetical protein